MRHHKYKSRTKGELIPTVIIVFKTMSDLYFSKEQWDEQGGYKGFLKNMGISIKEILMKVEILLNPSDYPTQEWEG